MPSDTLPNLEIIHTRPTWVSSCMLGPAKVRLRPFCRTAANKMSCKPAEAHQASAHSHHTTTTAPPHHYRNTTTPPSSTHTSHHLTHHLSHTTSHTTSHTSPIHRKHHQRHFIPHTSHTLHSTSPTPQSLTLSSQSSSDT